MAIERVERIKGGDFDPTGTVTGDTIAAQLGAVELIPDAGFSFGGGDSGGDSGGGRGDFDSTIHVSRDKRNADGSYTRKRGRRSGGGNSPSRTSSKADLKASVDSLANVLVIVHAGLAATLKTPEIALEPDESKALAHGVTNVLEQFDIRPDPKVEAVVGLIIAASSIYGPKVYLYRERKKAERAELIQKAKDSGQYYQ